MNKGENNMAEEKLLKDISKYKNYNWSLYFFKKDKRNKEQPFTATKIRYKNASAFNEYIGKLIQSITTLQLSTIQSFEEYNGMNPKISCDKLSTNSPLISDLWSKLVNSISMASNEKLKGKICGYAICGEPAIEELKPITILKYSSPIISLNNKYTITYKESPEEELDLVTDSFYRLYWIADSIIYEDTFYTFNNNFESVFDIEKAVQKVKDKAIESIINTNAIENIDMFKDLSGSYKSPKSFITLNEERLANIRDRSQRKDISQTYKLPLSSNDKFLTTNSEEYKAFIQYICFKSICEHKTMNVYEINSATKIEKDD